MHKWFLTACCGFLLGLTVVAADNASVQQVDSLPQGVPENFASVLDPVGASVLLDGKEVARFWFLKEWTWKQSPSTELGVNFGKIGTGSLVGVVELVDSWRDYKENRIPAGLYALRYEVMPADGNHMGVSPYRDYFLLVPLEMDDGPGVNLEYEDLVAKSMEATGVPHPGVMALYPMWDEVSETPAMMKNEMDQWSLVVQRDELVMALVVEGHGES